MDQYRRESLFSDSLDEFDSARYRLHPVTKHHSSSDVVQSVLDEYQLMEDSDYPMLSEARNPNIMNH